jgi:hypothetical protein
MTLCSNVTTSKHHPESEINNSTFQTQFAKYKKLMEREQQLGLEQLKLKQQCVTRWNSTYDMLERLVIVKDAVSSVIASIKTVEGLSVGEWEIAEGYVKLFKPFKILTASMSSSSVPTISMVIPELNKLKHTLQTDDGLETAGMPTIKEDLIASIDRRWPQYETNHVYAIATMVDPRYKDCGFNDDSNSTVARSLVLNEMMKMNTRPPANPATSQPSPTTSRCSGAQSRFG